MKKATIILRAGFAVALAMAWGMAAAAEFTLMLGHGASPSNPRHTVAEEMASYIKDASKGRIVIDVHPSESLGNDRNMAEKVSMGTLDMSINSQGPISSYVAKLNVVGLPFMFSKPEQVYAVLDGEIGESIVQELLPSGIRILAYWENGFRHITNNVRPINKPEDLKGLKIRTPEDRMTISIFKILGANPSPLAFGELYMALSQGLFDGQENPVTNIYYSKLHEVQKFISLTNHRYETCPLIISEATWERLPADLQRIIKEAAMKFAGRHRELNVKTNNDLIAEVEKSGVASNVADVAALREATKAVYAEFEPIFGKELIEKVQAVAAKH